MESVNCNICSLNNTKLVTAIEGMKIVKCNNCKLLYLNPRPTKSEINKLYQSGYYKNRNFFTGKYYGYYDYDSNIQGTIKTFEIVHRNIKNYKKTGKLLDFGCGPGIYLGVAEKDFKVKGLEISKEGFDKAKRKFEVINKPLEEANIKEKFDVITVFDVIEHLTDPKGTLIEFNNLLNKNGLLCIITPDADSLVARLLGSRWPEFRRWREHIYFFSRKTMERLLRDSGFELIKTHTIGKYFNLEGFINETKIFGKRLPNILLKFISILGLNEIQIYFNPLYKRVYYAKKLVHKSIFK